MVLELIALKRFKELKMDKAGRNSVGGEVVDRAFFIRYLDEARYTSTSHRTQRVDATWNPYFLPLWRKPER